MIFIVQQTVQRSEDEVEKLHDRLAKEINEDTKHRILCLPVDCELKVIDDYKAGEAHIVMKGREE